MPNAPHPCQTARTFYGIGVLLIALCACPDALAQGNWSGKVIATRDLAEKERLVCVNGNKDITPEVVAALIKRERHGPAVASAIGQYFEKSREPVGAPELLRAASLRPDIGAQAIAYASVSPAAPELIKGFIASENDDQQLIAARMLAAISVMRSAEPPKPKPKADKPKADKPAAKQAGGKAARLFRAGPALYKPLLTSKDERVLEYTLLAIGHEQIKGLTEQIEAHTSSRDISVAMAAQYALSRTGGEVDTAKVRDQLTARERKRRRGQAQPAGALTYDPRRSPRVYAVMAAGEVKDFEAETILFDLLKHEDPHVAVASARALGRLGIEGLPLRLLDAINMQTPWPVRIAVYDAAGAQPEIASIKRLRELYIEEDGRLRQDTAYALLSIIAGQAEAMSYDAFADWWSLNGKDFTVDTEATRAWRAEHHVGAVEVEPIAGFYASAVISDRPVFTVDASLSMKGEQIDSLKQMLNDVVLGLPDYVKFNIVDFGGHARVLAPGGMIPAQNRQQAMQEFGYDLELTLGTRTYDAIEKAILIPGMDTVQFLSDGAPYGSHVKSWRRISYITRLLCVDQPVAIQMVYFPPAKNAANAKNSSIFKQMKAYAEAHAGRAVVSTAK